MRKIAYEIVFGTLEKHKHSDELFHDAVSGSDWTGQEKSFLRRLSYGTIERAIELDYLLGHFSNMAVKKMKPVIRTILRMGAYEICYMDAVPVAASCNEMVNLAKEKGCERFGGFVNGILRNLARADLELLRKEILGQLKSQSKRFSFQYSVPEELADLLLKSYGKKSTRRILTSFYEEKPLNIRVHHQNATEEQVRKELEEAGAVVEECHGISGAFRLLNVSQIEQLPGFDEGHFTVQDVSSQLPVVVSGIEPGDYVVDICSSPGGKALQAVDCLNGMGLVSARDVSEKKIEKILENAERLRAKEQLEVKIWDGRVPDDRWREKADVLLADVPCSGIGVIGKKPEIKYEAIKNADGLVPLQREIVSAAIEMLKPGGVFIYSTCTINPEENEKNVQWMEEHLPLRRTSLNEFLPEALCNHMTLEGMLQILPGIQDGDGFFVARFVKEV